MPRAKQFDPNKLLSDVMALFWEKGYNGTSMDDIVQYTGVSRYGIYATFKNKRHIYIEALNHYAIHILAPFLEGLEKPNAGLDDIRNYYESLNQLSDTEMARLGCFICNTIVELSAHDPDISTQANTHTDKLHKALCNALNGAILKGELRPIDNINSYANYLVGIDIGIMTLIKNNRNKTRIKDIIDTTFNQLSRTLEHCA